MLLFPALSAVFGVHREKLSVLQMTQTLNTLLLELTRRDLGFASGMLADILKDVEARTFEAACHVATERHWGVCEVGPVSYGAEKSEEFTWPGPWDKRVVGPVCSVRIPSGSTYKVVMIFAREGGLFPIVTYEGKEHGGGGFPRRCVVTKRDILLMSGANFAQWLPETLDRQPMFFLYALEGAERYVYEQIKAREQRLEAMRDTAAAIRHFRGMAEALRD